MHRARLLWPLAVVFTLPSLAGCGDAQVRQGGPASIPKDVRKDARGLRPELEIELVESAPLETTLDHADVRDAFVVWPEMIDRATRSIDLAEFYASEAEGDALKTSRLGPIVTALERALQRGVHVRFLGDSVFAKKYPDTLARLKSAGADVRTIDFGARAGGVLHAKYFIVDAKEAFVGSQNFDWRALAHIQEMGIRLRSEALAHALGDVFDTDWALAAGGRAEARTHTIDPKPLTSTTGEAIDLVASPKGWLPDEQTWELPKLVALLDGAKRAIDLQVLMYSVKNRDGSAFTTLDEAVRRAAARGVHVKLLASSWADKPDSASRRSLDELARLPNIEVRILTIPPWSGGDVPFARVAHAKYLVVDGVTAWVGTSNWEGDYFLRSRNVGIIAGGGKLPPRLQRIFDDGWSSGYARPLSVAAAAPPPSSSGPARP